MDLDQLRDIDFNEIGNAPLSVRAVVVVIVVVAILAVGYFLQIKGQREQLQQVTQEEQGLRQTFETKQHQAANLDAYRDQLERMRSLLRQMLRQLPSKTEMPDLLVDISQTALATGIRTELFEPQQEAIKGFYAELPVSIRMIGTYHQFGEFISGVAALPRVVVVDVDTIALAESDSNSRLLEMNGTIRTFRYLSEQELANQSAGNEN